MLIFCPLATCHFLCIIFILFMFSTYHYIHQISNTSTKISNTYSLNENPIGEKSNALSDDFVQEDEIKIENATFSFTDDKEFTNCFVYLVIMSTCMFFICNIYPEYCFRKRIKIEKCKYFIMQKACGCIVEYDTKEVP